MQECFVYFSFPSLWNAKGSFSELCYLRLMNEYQKALLSKGPWIWCEGWSGRRGFVKVLNVLLSSHRDNIRSDRALYVSLCWGLPSISVRHDNRALSLSLSLSRLLLVLTVISVPPQNFTKKCLNTITQHAIDLWSNNISVHLSLCACLFRFSFELRKKHKEWLSSYEKQFLLALRSLINFSELVNIHQLFIYSNSLHNIDPV